MGFNLSIFLTDIIFTSPIPNTNSAINVSILVCAEYLVGLIKKI